MGKEEDWRRGLPRFTMAPVRKYHENEKRQLAT
jgi:hypothetical protein